MPRLPTLLLRHARAQEPLLVPLLHTCRDLKSARNELRWLKEHVEQDLIKQGLSAEGSAARQYLRRLCQDRGRGKPLQYILGTEYFGELELLCRPGVLIPRSVASCNLMSSMSSFPR
jgi:methylase of polypeptide subunit release factors